MVPIFFRKQIRYKFQKMLKNQRNSGNCNFFRCISSRSGWFDYSEFHQYSSFTTFTQDSRMKFVINPMDVLIFVQKNNFSPDHVIFQDQILKKRPDRPEISRRAPKIVLEIKHHILWWLVRNFCRWGGSP